VSILSKGMNAVFVFEEEKTKFNKVIDKWQF